MSYLALLFLLAPTLSTASSLGGAMHGNLSIEYLIKSKQHLLILSEKLGNKPDGLPILKELATYDLKISNTESLSTYNGYWCKESGQEVYGVLPKSKLSAQKPLTPLRAWRVNQTSKKLETITNLNSVTCLFEDIGH